MRRRRIAGISLIVVAFVLLFGFIVFPVIPQFANSPVFDSVLGAVLCQPNETLVREQYSQTFGSEQNFSMNAYCQDAKGNRTDVTGKWTEIGVVGFIVLFLLGMYITTGTLPENQKRKRTPDDSDKAFRITPEQISEYRQKSRAQHASADGSVRVVANGSFSLDPSSNKGDFSDKLRQIQKAHDNGLISTEEYERLRQEILDNMG